MNKIIIGILLVSVLSFGENVDVTQIAKDYPYKNSAIVATVVGTPSSQWYNFKKAKAPLVRTIKSNKKIPEILKDWSKYDYGVWVQKKEAPLMIIISGTGSTYDSGLSLYMANVFYDRGYNVIAFSSPTTMPYIVSQSKNNYAGYIKDEAEHLYEIMEEAINKAKKNDKMKISKTYVGGYSLGGFQSLLIHEIDKKEHKLNIAKSLILNSPVSIFTATKILDEFLVQNGIYDAKSLEKYFDTKFKEIINNKDIHLNDINVSNIMNSLVSLKMTEKDFEILTGFLFRFYSANMTFAGEVFSGKNNAKRLSDKTEYKRFDSVTKEFLEGFSVSFEEYSTEILYPTIKKKNKNLNFDDFVKDFDLKNSEKFIKENNNDIVFITSEDDILLTESDKKYIKETFNNRVLIPFGGHTGILWHKDVAKLMVDKLEEEVK